MKKDKRLLIEVITRKNGYSLNVGKKIRAMYFTEEELAAGFFDHVMLKEMDYMNTETIKHLMEAAAAWPTNEEALMAIAHVKDDCALAQKKERQAQTQVTKLIHQIETLEKKLEDMTKKYTNAKMKLSAYEKIYEHKKVK
jgi:uncharacterized protein YlxW (UPF0749 family)